MKRKRTKNNEGEGKLIYSGKPIKDAPEHRTCPCTLHSRQRILLISISLKARGEKSISGKCSQDFNKVVKE